MEQKETLSELTPKQSWMFNYIHLQWLNNNNQDYWVSPTEIGRQYGKWLYKDRDGIVPHSYHSAASSPTCKILVEKD